MEVVSHRGNCCGGAENSLVAIERAWDAEADAVEVDLRMSGDKVIILFHDKKINGKLISSLSFEEIQEINSEVPALDYLLSSMTPSGYYIFDLKEYTHEYINSLSKTIPSGRHFGFLSALRCLRPYTPKRHSSQNLA